MFFSKKTGFTLVELLVVISIIGILAAALTTQVTKVRETARAAKCKANLKNLAQASTSYAVQSTFWPFASSGEDSSYSVASHQKQYNERKAWVQWVGSGSWPSASTQSGLMKSASFYGSIAFQSVTNGVLWEFVGKDLSVYVCEAHRAEAEKVSAVRSEISATREGMTRCLRSYVMNGYFCNWENCRMDNVNADGKAGNLLVFAELPAQKVETSNTARDGSLDTKTYSSNEEYIGFNHLVGKRYVAHVVFADGHVDALMEPSGKADADLKSLTKELCAGEEIDQTVRSKMH